MSFSNMFIGVIDHIENTGEESKPRDLKVKETVLANITIDPLDCIANFKDRPFNWKYLSGELSWYLKKDRDVNYIGKFSNFWNRITNPGTNEINSNYGHLVLNEQLVWVVNSLKADKNSRQAIMFFNRPEYQFDGNKDFVCTMYANFFIRDNQLHMKVQMRSNDIFYGLTFDAPFFSFLHQSVFLILKDEYPDLELGWYFHFADNLHFYERHFELSEEIKENGTLEDHTFILLDKFVDIVEDRVVFTPTAKRYIKEVEKISNSEAHSSQENYKQLLSEYFELDGYGDS